MMTTPLIYSRQSVSPKIIQSPRNEQTSPTQPMRVVKPDRSFYYAIVIVARPMRLTVPIITIQPHWFKLQLNRRKACDFTQLSPRMSMSITGMARQLWQKSKTAKLSFCIFLVRIVVLAKHQAAPRIMKAPNNQVPSNEATASSASPEAKAQSSASILACLTSSCYELEMQIQIMPPKLRIIAIISKHEIVSPITKQPSIEAQKGAVWKIVLITTRGTRGRPNKMHMQQHRSITQRRIRGQRSPRQTWKDQPVPNIRTVQKTSIRIALIKQRSNGQMPLSLIATLRKILQKNIAKQDKLTNRTAFNLFVFSWPPLSYRLEVYSTVSALKKSSSLQMVLPDGDYLASTIGSLSVSMSDSLLEILASILSYFSQRII